MLIASGVTPKGTKQLDAIECYGVYVVAEKGFVKIGPSPQGLDGLVNFKYVNEIQYVKRADKTLKLIVYKKNFSEDSYIFELRPVGRCTEVSEVYFDIKPLPKTDMYELTLDTPVEDGATLHLRSGDSVYGIMLGEIQTQLVAYFSQETLPEEDAPFIKRCLETVCEAFPGNAKLAELATQWDQAAKVTEDKKVYYYVEEKWQLYEQADKIALKARYLEDLVGEINVYLERHSSGYKADEAKQRHRHAEVKLREYQKQL